MSRASQDSSLDFERLQERTRYTERDQTPDTEENGRADNDFAHVGAGFGDTLSRRTSLAISDVEESSRDPSQVEHLNGIFHAVDVTAEGGMLSRSTTTPTPTQPLLGSHTQLPTLTPDFARRGRRARRRRRRHPNPGSQSSISTSGGGLRATDLSSEDDNMDDGDDYSDEHDRSRTPTQRHTHTPYIEQSYTPSHHSAGTEEEHGEGQGPTSPNPWSPEQPYTKDQRHRDEAIAGVDEHFPAEVQPRAE